MKELALLLQLVLCLSANLTPSSGAVNKTSSLGVTPTTTWKPRTKNHTLILIISQSKLLNRRTKFPIIPPSLKFRSTTTTSTTSPPPPTTTAVSTTTISSTTTTTTTTSTANSTTKQPKATLSSKSRRKSFNGRNSTNPLRQGDIFEQSSSDNSPSIAWPVPRRPATNRRMWTSSSNQASSEEEVVKRPVPKLLLPRPTRPAMYSLDGFVPKPSILRITTTEAPPHIKARYSNSIAPKTNKRKWYGRQSLDDEEDDEPQDYSGSKFAKRTQTSRSKSSVSRYTAFKRKGTPGKDYPVHAAIPATDFDCTTKSGPGMYADPQAGCQVWHMCPGNAPHRYSFMCPNGTIFNEHRGVCDWWYNVSCIKLETPSPTNTFRRRFGRSPDEDDLP